MAGTQNQIPYDQIPDAVMYILNRNGRTVEELEEEHGSRYLAAPPPKKAPETWPSGTAKNSLTSLWHES